MLLGSNYRNDAVEKLYGDRIGDSSIIFTPWDTVENMLDLIPEDFWTPDVTILDMYCKSGRFLVGAFRKLYNSPYLAYLSDGERTLHILNKQLFGLCADMTCMLLSEANLYGYAQYGKKHIKLVDTYDYNSVVKQRKDGIINRTLEGKFGQMKFDLVIGNPPYNKDAYIDFVEIGHKLATQYSCWVTPAKWQAKADKKNDTFRKAIVPYMQSIVYYPSSREVFEIDCQGGIVYYLIGKTTSTYKKLKTLCNKQPLLATEGGHEFETCEIKNILYNESIRHIVDKLGTYTQLACRNKRALGKYNVAITNIYSEKDCTNKDGRAYVIISPYVTTSTEKANVDTSFLDSFETESEALSYVSYLQTKFVRFMFLLAKSSLHMQSAFSWQFVPDPGSFDHIFTDEELYKKYNLTPEEINIIESVIKERK